MRHSIFSIKFLLSTILIASAYFAVASYFMNWNLFLDTFLGAYPLTYKLNILWLLITSMWSIMPMLNVNLVLLVSFLSGLNTTLLVQRYLELNQSKRLHLVSGSGTFLGVIGSGCAACGLPILNLVGLGGSIVYLPFQGIELSIISIVLLLTSSFLMLRNKKNEKGCAVPILRTATINI